MSFGFRVARFGLETGPVESFFTVQPIPNPRYTFRKFSGIAQTRLNAAYTPFPGSLRIRNVSPLSSANLHLNDSSCGVIAPRVAPSDSISGRILWRAAGSALQSGQQPPR
jgi:hypothetical protein